MIMILFMFILLLYPLPTMLVMLINYYQGRGAKIKVGEEKTFGIVLNLALTAVLGTIQTIIIGSFGPASLCGFSSGWAGGPGSSCYQKGIFSQLIMPGIIIYVLMFFIGLMFFKFGRSKSKNSNS